MFNFRRFPADVEDVAAQAAQTPILTCGFTQTGPASPTADGAFPVDIPFLGRHAFAKPAKDHPKAWRTVVHEKLASDLAFDVGLPIPPVHVISAGGQYSPWLAVSHIPFPAPRAFSERQAAGIADDFWGSLENVATAMRVFYTWINDVDHLNHEQNFLFGRPAPGADVALAFIDHSYSISHSLPARQDLAPSVHHLFKNDDHGVMREVVRRIEAVNRSRIEHLVCRLRKLLPQGEEQTLTDLIVDGKETARQAVKRITGGT